MDYTPIINEVFNLWVLIPISLLILFFKSPWFKGALGEALVKFAAKLRLPKETYHRIHNVTLPTPDGTTQIDHIFISRFGIFVVETKNMKGWIFGSEKQAQWTQKIYKASYKFQNPLRQNFKHVKALEALLDVPNEALKSVVVFAGESTFKSPMPSNVTQGGGYISYIKSHTDPVLSDLQVQEIISKIESGRLAPSRETNRQHVQHVKDRSNSQTVHKCPKCGSAMTKRTARKGENVGKAFWGCSSFPKCRYVRNASDESKRVRL